jgi:hypothetical protein
VEGQAVPEVEGRVVPEVEGQAAPEVEGQVVPEVEGEAAPEVKECPAAPVAVSLAEGQAEVKLVAAPVAANSSQ